MSRPSSTPRAAIRIGRHVWLRRFPWVAREARKKSPKRFCGCSPRQRLTLQERFLRLAVDDKGRRWPPAPVAGTISRCAAARNLGRSGTLQVQYAGDEFTHGNAQVAPKAAFEAGVILRSTEKIAHQLAKHRAAVHELDHVRGYRRAEKSTAVEPPHNARGEFQFGRECRFDPRHVLFRAAFCE